MLSAIPPKRADSSNWEPRRELSGCSAGSLGQTDGTEVVTVRVRVDLADPFTGQKHRVMLNVIHVRKAIRRCCQSLAD